MSFTDFPTFAVFFASLAGIGALITCLINILKTIGLVKDGQASTYSVGLNLLGLIVLFVLGVIKPAVNVQGLDQSAGQIANILVLVFGFIWQLVSSRFTHNNVLKGTPLIGTSYTIQAELAKAKAFEQQIIQRTTA
ncbi:MAG: hypothetical protein P4L50_15915 [Anaerolineaceae bacterium]|nr:hypothetical protein [Anaerolineaceae bacterium]